MTDRLPRVPRPSPTFRRQLDRSLELAREALADPGVREALTAARAAADGWGGEELAPDFVANLEWAIRLIAERYPELTATFGRATVHSLLVSRTLGVDAFPAKIRMQGLPGIEAGAIRLLLDDEDVRALQGELSPGQVWVNATALDLTHYRDLWGVISYQPDGLLGPHRSQQPSFCCASAVAKTPSPSRRSWALASSRPSLRWTCTS